MKTRSSTPLLLAAAGFVLAVSFSTTAYGKTFAETIVGEGDRVTGYGDVQEQESLAYAPSSVVGTFTSAHDLAVVGGNGLLNYEGHASAWARIDPFGQYLGTSTSGMLTNSFFDPDYNNAEETGDIPTVYGAQAAASFTEVLQYGGTATSYTSRYYFRLTGTISGSGNTFISLHHALAAPQTFYFSEPGSYDQIITSSAFVHGLSPQEITLRMVTQTNFYTDEMDEGDDATGTADFGSTLEFLGVELRDQDGNLMPNGTITSQSGSTYNVIPEPTVSALLGLAACGLGWRRRR